MKFKELFLKYGIASLFGVTRYLHTEVERLQLRVWQLEHKLDEVGQPQYQPSGYEDLDNDSPLEDGWFDGVTELDNNGQGKVVARDEIFGRTARPKNIRRTVDDLYREAKKSHDSLYERRAVAQALEQETIVEEMIEHSVVEDDRPVEVIVSEAKKNFLTEAGRALMQQKSE